MFGPGKPKPRFQTDQELVQRVRNVVPDRINSALEEQSDRDCPTQCLCHDVDQRRTAELVKEFSNGLVDKTEAVYVLECQWKTVSQRVAREELRLQNDVSWVGEAQKNQRLVYVGVSTDVPSRLLKHSLGRGAGANFTRMFPPTRLLSIQWFKHESDAYRAEELTADILREETHSGVYVSQPG